MAAKYTTDKQINSLKIYPTGYYIHCRIDGKRREKKIAPRNVLINIARKEAQKILGLIAQGIDPFEEKKKKQKADEYTVVKTVTYKKLKLPTNNTI